MAKKKVKKRSSGGDGSRVTIVDLAEAVGVTDGTVSRALAGDPRVKEATRQKVLEAATQLGYRPNVSARSLRQGKSNALGVFCEGGAWIFYNDYFGRLVAGLAQEAAKDKVQLVFYLPEIQERRGKTPYQWDIKLQGLQSLQDGRVDGAIILGGRSAEPEELMAFQSTGLPVVLLSPDKPVPGVAELGGAVKERTAQAVQALIEQGHKKIGMVGLYKDSGHNELAIQAWSGELKKAGLKAPDELIEEITEISVNEPEDIRTKTTRLRAMGATGIIYCDIRQAVVAMDLMADEGVSIPRDLSVVSFGPRPDELKSHHPLISLVEADLEEEGRECYRLYKDVQEKKSIKKKAISWSLGQQGETIGPPPKA